MTTAISIYKNIHDVSSLETIHVTTFLEAIQSGKWQDAVLKIRTIKNHDDRQAAKKSLPYVTISGIFGEGRKIEGLSKHSGLISMDLDGLGTEVEATRQLLSNDPYVFSIFTSASGTGLCVLFKIEPEKHREAFDGIANYLINQYQLVIDPSGKDVSRPRYVSYDPELYLNEKSLLFRKYLPKPKARKVQATIYVQEEFDRVVKEMADKNVSCVEDYRDWRDIGFGLADKFGESGRPYFHALSSVSAKYEPSMCDRQYTHCMRGNGKTGSKITIATIYWYAKQAGIQTTSDRTKKITSATNSMKKAGLSGTDIAKNLKQFEGIENADDIINQAFASNVPDSNSLVDNLRMHLRHNYSLRRNVITRKIENNGTALDEISINTMFLDCLIIFDKLTFDLFCKVLFSNNTPEYNPITDWFKENEHFEPSGVIEDFFDCFETDNDINFFGKKWLVSIVASAFGDHSPLMLILAGEKHGSGKTESFRRMLPEPLRPYYAEVSQGMKDTDMNIMLTQKLIVMDDECGGKSKKDAMHLKSMLSKQTFTLREPYGKMNIDLKRLAVLCGTTNDLEILNDPTGNRRMIPIEIKWIDFDRYNKINKTHLFIEAYHLYKNGFDWQVSGKDIEKLAEKNDKFNETSSEYELIIQYYKPGNEAQLTATEIKVWLERHTNQKLSLKRIGMELKRCGFEQHVVKIEKRSQRLYSCIEIGRPVFSGTGPTPF